MNRMFPLLMSRLPALDPEMVGEVLAVVQSLAKVRDDYGDRDS